ncbi:hypothetical protein DQ238_01820 [Geodermatophilus sp. TF02-6]|uniref:helix-turn-helix domain-containing protein n=1 Tax=Geodermatophilus sp. TF02-6 TaxID=2250575 RepID=UPI000DEACC5B|nr:helix-turn-helix domain-containing protein [Geodermatophilus sp. TF02-6]RBY83823.1 hypothetical protein DQ238_01820 [Geodermatophilus sp. TF02-6]
MKNASPYAIRSVDSALRLAAALQVEGPLSVSEAADRLGVARSTAHWLLAMLVYRDFAEQLPDRRYAAGPVLRSEFPQAPVTRLREVALPHLRRVVDAVGETAGVVAVVCAPFVRRAACRPAGRRRLSRRPWHGVGRSSTPCWSSLPSSGPARPPRTPPVDAPLRPTPSRFLREQVNEPG